MARIGGNQPGSPGRSRVAGRLWPLVLVAGMAMVTACGTGRPVATGGSPAVPPVAATRPGLPVHSIEPPGRDDPAEPTAKAPPVEGAATVAAAFATAWARPDLPAERWWAGVAPLCEKGFAEKLRTVDPANLPATKITGTPVTATPPADGVGTYTVATDGGTLVVTIAAINGAWLVTNNDFRRDVG